MTSRWGEGWGGEAWVKVFEVLWGDLRRYRPCSQRIGGGGQPVAVEIRAAGVQAWISAAVRGRERARRAVGRRRVRGGALKLGKKSHHHTPSGPSERPPRRTNPSHPPPSRATACGGRRHTPLSTGKARKGPRFGVRAENELSRGRTSLSLNTHFCLRPYDSLASFSATRSRSRASDPGGCCGACGGPHGVRHERIGEG